MASSDPIADMLTTIRNAINVRKNVVTMPTSKLKQQVADVLAESGFIESVEVVDGDRFPMLRITLHGDDENARITDISRLSKPGRRLYAKADELPRIMNGRGVVVVSTSKGLMSDQQARDNKVGGELVCKVY
jgi:small subunit ribosomal protein S8